MHLQKLKINPLLVFINILAKGIFKCFPFKLKLELGRAGEIKLNSCLACTQGWYGAGVVWDGGRCGAEWCNEYISNSVQYLTICCFLIAAPRPGLGSHVLALTPAGGETFHYLPPHACLHTLVTLELVSCIYIHLHIDNWCWNIFLWPETLKRVSDA